MVRTPPIAAAGPASELDACAASLQPGRARGTLLRQSLGLMVMIAAVSALAAGAAGAQALGLGPLTGSDGAPMRPLDAGAGPWTLSVDGQIVCTLSLNGVPAPSGVYGVQIPPDCGLALPPGVVGWAQASDGLALVGADGRTLADFSQWTARDLVARRNGAPVLELKR